ncbi:hypothetical protein ODI_R3181 [Orrella dioscoreae]|uniref:Uncharacterized protein n=2 Tax=root TaxID=1 RepID=A0A1C3K0L9_9BURK|nr:hypothetical protein ODI_00337 [Orrella dioscoreae]SOE51084.1 hypothetical protein ODI_R3181 [Orrella dioscoreae]
MRCSHLLVTRRLGKRPSAQCHKNFMKQRRAALESETAVPGKGTATVACAEGIRLSGAHDKAGSGHHSCSRRCRCAASSWPAEVLGQRRQE